jgi:phosphate transport system substrate-binding protein
MLRRRKIALALASVALAAGSLAVAGCGDDDDDGDSGSSNLSGTITIDGSSTVAPLSEAAAELFQQENPDVRVTVGTSGTGGGFEKFCRGEIDISDASRPIKVEEIAACESAGIAFEQVDVANDALSVIKNPENDWATCLTVEELNKIWDRGSNVNNWNQVNPDFPDEPLVLFGPGTDSGTFDYFTDEINGEEGVQRTDYNNIGEDDNAAVTGVAGTKGGLGYLGYSFFAENEGTIEAVEIDGGDGCVAPSAETAQDGTYVPLGRQLFIYPSSESLTKPEVKAFVEFYINNNDEIAERAQIIPLNDEQKQEALDKVAELTSGEAGGETTE